jgi:hypothetical protein
MVSLAQDHHPGNQHLRGGTFPAITYPLRRDWTDAAGQQ